MTPIEKVTEILRVLSNEPYEFKVAEISSISGINRSTVHRILSELAEDGWVIQDETTKRFKIGPMTYHVGSIYHSNNNYESKLLDVLNDASVKCRESVGYAVREGDRVISLYEIEFYQPYKLNYHAGQFYPMNRGCYGKCLMAYHDQTRVKELLRTQQFEKLCPNTIVEPQQLLQEYENIRNSGYVVSDEEIMPNLVGVGVPVFNSRGMVKACIAIAFIKSTDYLDRIEEFKQILLAAAKKISHYIP